jgi:hypothetical protein
MLKEMGFTSSVNGELVFSVLFFNLTMDKICCNQPITQKENNPRVKHKS